MTAMRLFYLTCEKIQQVRVGRAHISRKGDRGDALQVHPSGLEPELTVPKTVVISVSL